MKRRMRRQGVLEEVADGSADRFSQFSGAPWGMRPTPGDALPAPRDGGSPILRRRHHPEVPHRKMDLPSRRARPELPRAGLTRLTRGAKPAPIAGAALRPGPIVVPAPPPRGGKIEASARRPTTPVALARPMPLRPGPSPQEPPLNACAAGRRSRQIYRDDDLASLPMCASALL